jgi:hypothetical protein
MWFPRRLDNMSVVHNPNCPRDKDEFEALFAALNECNMSTFQSSMIVSVKKVCGVAAS